MLHLVSLNVARIGFLLLQSTFLSITFDWNIFDKAMKYSSVKDETLRKNSCWNFFLAMKNCNISSSTYSATSSRDLQSLDIRCVGLSKKNRELSNILCFYSSREMGKVSMEKRWGIAHPMPALASNAWSKASSDLFSLWVLTRGTGLRPSALEERGRGGVRRINLRPQLDQINIGMGVMSHP